MSASDSAYTISLDQLLDEVDGLGIKLTFATVTAGGCTTTDARINQMGADLATSRYAGRFISNASGDVRSITTISVPASGVVTITHAGGDWTTNGSPSTGYIRAIWPETLRSLSNDALGHIPGECFIPLYHGPTDADMQLAGVSNWSDTNATSAKQTTAAEVLTAARSMSVTLSAGSGYTQGGLVNMGQSERGTAFAIAKADTGTGILRVLDNGSNTVESVSFSQEDWVFLKKSFTLGSDDEGARLRLLGTDNLDQIDWQGAWIVKTNQHYFNLPTWIDERFKVKAVTHWRLLTAAGTDAWLAADYEEERLREGIDYHLIVRQANANPSGVRIDASRADLMTEPLFLVVEAPYSAPYGVSAIFAADSDTNPCPPHLLVPYMKHLLGLHYPAVWPELAKTSAKDDLSTPGYREYAERLAPRQTSSAPREQRIERMYYN